MRLLVSIAAALFVLLSCLGDEARADDYILPESGEPYFRHDGHVLHGLRFLPADDRIVSETWTTVALWDLKTRRLIREHRFPARMSRIWSDARDLIYFEPSTGFVEFDSATLKPAAVESEAIRFLTEVHKAHPEERRTSDGTKVSGFFRGKDGAMACTYIGGFCFAPQPDPKTWFEFDCHSPSFASGSMTVVYSDERTGRFRDVNAARHIIGERLGADGSRTQVFKIPIPKGYDGYPRISDDGSVVLCSWHKDPEASRRRRGDEYVVEAFRGDTGAPLGRTELRESSDYRLLDMQLDAQGKKLAIIRTDQTVLYDITPSGFVERRRLALNLPYYSGIRLVPDTALERFAVFQHGNGFALVDPKNPMACLDAVVTWVPWGLLGDDTVVLKSNLGFKCAALSPTAAKPLPEVRLPETDLIARAEDRSCLLALSLRGEATVYRRRDVLLRGQDIADERLDKVVVAGDGKRCAYCANQFVHVLELRDGKGYVEIHAFEAGARVQDLKMTADGRSLLTAVDAPSSAGSRVTVYHDDGKEWNVRCVPFDSGALVAAAAFVGNDLVVARKYDVPPNIRTAHSEIEARRISTGKVVDTSSVDYLNGFAT